MPVLDARAFDADPEGLALLRSVLDDVSPEQRARRQRLPALEAFDPARRRPFAAEAPLPAENGRNGRRRPALALGS